MLVSVTNRRNGMVERLSFNAWWMAAQHYSGPGFRDLYVQDVSGSWIRKQDAVYVTGKGYVTPLYYAMYDAAKSFFEEVNELISAGYELLSYNIEQNRLYAYFINASGEKTNLGFGFDVVIVGHKKRNEPAGQGGEHGESHLPEILGTLGWVSHGMIGSAAELTAQGSFKYGQRINGVVKSAAQLTKETKLFWSPIAKSFNTAGGVLGAGVNTYNAINDYSEGNYGMAAFNGSKALCYIGGTICLFVPGLQGVGGYILVSTLVVDVAGDVVKANIGN